MKITKCVVGYKSAYVHQDEVRVTKPEFQPFYDGEESINEVTMKLSHLGTPIKNLPNPEIEYVIFDIEDLRLPRNTVMVVYLNFDESYIGIGLLEYDNDPDVQLPLREMVLGNINDNPLENDGKLFFIGDLRDIVDDYAKEAKKVYKNKKGN